MYSDNPDEIVHREAFEVDGGGSSAMMAGRYSDNPADALHHVALERRNRSTANSADVEQFREELSESDDEEEQALMAGTVARTRLSAAQFLRGSWYPVYIGALLLVVAMIVAIVLVPGHERPAEGQLDCELMFTDKTSWTTLQHVVANSTELRCVVEETPCQCQNPTLPQKSYVVGWENSAAKNLDYIDNATATNERHLDVVIVGDSLVEHWHGTTMGQPDENYANNVAVFDQLFNLQAGAELSGLALGIAGDRCPQLLYRLANGEMPETLQPELWWIVIGTNDRGGDQCKNDEVIVGNIAIVQYILKQRPLATVVINSLLPRGNEEYLYWWNDYTYINRALECYASGQEQVEFFNATDLFLTSNGQGVNKTLLPDEIHPTEYGSWKWGRAIVAKVQEILDERRNRR